MMIIYGARKLRASAGCEICGAEGAAVTQACAL
jgi:hypothetical protein